jgi:hypothetical protein
LQTLAGVQNAWTLARRSVNNGLLRLETDAGAGGSANLAVTVKHVNRAELNWPRRSTWPP